MHEFLLHDRRRGQQQKEQQLVSIVVMLVGVEMILTVRELTGRAR